MKTEFQGVPSRAKRGVCLFTAVSFAWLNMTAPVFAQQTSAVAPKAPGQQVPATAPKASAQQLAARNASVNDAAAVIYENRNARSAASAPMFMYKGEVRVIPIEGKVKRVAVGNGDLINASVVDHQLLLLAQAPGETSLVVWTDQGMAINTKVSVSTLDRNATLARLQRSLGFVEGLSIDANGGHFIVHGKVHAEQAKMLSNALDGLPDVINLIETDEGSSLKKTVHFKVDILEISKTAERNLGIKWDSQINGPQGSLAGNAVRTGRYRPFPDTGTAVFDNAPSSAGGSVGGAFLGIATSITSKINILAANGDAFVLAQPELNSRSGGKATFLSGGEVPIPVSAGFGAQDVIYKEYGIRLEIAPTVDATNTISADLMTEISQIDPSMNVNGYPAFLTRRSTTQVSVRPGETFAIAGLVNADASKAVDKVPALGDIPILGHLFKSTDFRNNKSDLVFLVTPYVVDASSPTNTSLINRGADVDANYRHSFGDPSPLPEANARREEEVREQNAPTPQLPKADPQDRP